MEELYKRHSQIVYHFLYARCRDPALAEDLMQETFLRAMESIDSFNGSCKMSTWLCQIAKHLLYQYWAKNGRIQMEELDEELPASGSTEEQAIARIELLDVWDKLQKLSPDMQKVVELRALGDLSYREIGEMLGKSENWARVIFYRAKILLLKSAEK
ncbi:MAG: sigma-70 family RNA polymerase sigma factor [Acetatifactor sp.]|nr:sigma-70 family RNA polymerase sigma factor [Acetatifactor sp.]